MKTTDTSRPLVSVVVLTYNQHDLVTETLDSIAAQSHPAVEIVVSDDHSTDRTIDVVREWGRRNPEARLVVVSSEVNTGTSANINRGVAASRGEWIKILAGDDLLVPHAIARYLDYCDSHNTEVCVSRLRFFGTDTGSIELKKRLYGQFYHRYTRGSEAQKRRMILLEGMIPMPGLFMSRALFDSIGGIDERWPFCEEWPTWIAIMEQGRPLPMFEDELVEYRCNGNTLGSRGDGLMSERVFRDQKKHYVEQRRSKMLAEGMRLKVLDQDFNYFTLGLLYKPTHRRMWRVVHRALILANPATYINYVRNAKIRE
jgi:alpha-1,3-rhamnosyltransferase